ncbi:glycine zipper domain-containing protein [Mangrovibacter yixingensis]|uniref:glycine zipper domain-containing protein n=1 Tax=Mangrovibacter yixingensis TaxID=1529639 RepID=UPI001CFB5CFD
MFRKNKQTLQDIPEDQAMQDEITNIASTLEKVLDAWDSDAKDERDNIKHHATRLLSETRARLNGHNRLQQATLDAAHHTDEWVRNRPWHSIGLGAAAGMIVGALLTRK